MKNIPEYYLTQVLIDYFNNQGYYTKKEFSVGYGRADIVACKLKNNWDSFIRDIPHDPLPDLLTLSIYVNFPNIIHTFIVFNSRNNGEKPSKKYFDKIKWLLENKYLFIENESFYKNNLFEIIDEIIAVEIKVKDWLVGARKAYRYNIFADRVFLALDQGHTKRINEDILKCRNIGIISIDLNNREINIRYEPLRGEPNPIIKTITVNMFLTDIIKNTGIYHD